MTDFLRHHPQAVALSPINSFLAYAMGEEEISLKAKTKDSTDDRTSTADRRNAR